MRETNIEMNGRNRAILFIVVGLTLLTNLWWVQNRLRAHLWLKSYSTIGIVKAADMEPRNADSQHLAGRFHLFAEQDWEKAIVYFRKAIAQNSHESRYHVDAALAYGIASKSDEAYQAIKDALKLGPTDTEIIWEAANMHLAAGEDAEAYRLLSILANVNMKLAYRVYTLAWRYHPDEKILMERIPPKTSHAFRGLLQVIIQFDQSRAGVVVWERFRAAGFQLDANELYPYIDYQIERNPNHAEAAWRKIYAAEDDFRNRNYIYDASFEGQTINRGFGWRFEENAVANVAYDTMEAKSGNRSLRVVFKGGSGLVGFFQYLVLKPNTSYRFQGFTKSSGIMATDPPHLAIFGNEGVLLGRGPDLIGSQIWSEQSFVFRTSHNGSIGFITLRRNKGESTARGTLWLDSFELKEVSDP